MRRALSFAIALSMSASAQAPPVFRSEVAFVYVDVFVVDRGRPVTGLRASDFELKDNGVVQAMQLVATESRPIVATLVFDTSSSVAGEKVVALRAAGEAFLSGLRPSDEAGLVTFSEEISLRVEPTVDRSRLRAALAGLAPEGATAVFDALYATLALADPQGRSLVVLFTDGVDNSSLLGERQLRIVADRSNALVHVVGLRAPESTQVRVLRDVAEASGGRYWSAESPGRLGEAFAAIAGALSQRYVLRYEPKDDRSGWHTLSVRLRRGQGRVEARRGYWIAGGPRATPKP